MTTQTDPFMIQDMSKWIPHKPETWPFHFVTLKKPVTLYIWKGHRKPEETRVVPAGKTVRIVMVSRLGDVGITDNLSAETGYHARITFDEFPEVFENPRSAP